jgi:hypothetical protein
MKKIFVFAFLISSLAFPQTWEYFPNELNVNPFIANPIEPRMGFMFKTEGNELRLDIGNSMDLAWLETKSGKFSVGADFFTWTLLKKEENFHFPVDAVDYLFGLNFGYKRVAHDYSFGTRVRISHISAHLVDGHFDKTNYLWLNGQMPRVYSREFIEVMPFYQYRSLRMYIGLTYLFHVDPEVNRKDQYQAGFDYVRKDFIYDNVSPFIALDAKLTDRFAESPNISFHAGIKFGKQFGRGLSIYYDYYSGVSLHGEYYDFREKYSGIGLNLDL